MAWVSWSLSSIRRRVEQHLRRVRSAVVCVCDALCVACVWCGLVSNAGRVGRCVLCRFGGSVCVSHRVAGYLVDPASSHMLVSKIKPCMSKYKRLVL